MSLKAVRKDNVPGAKLSYLGEGWPFVLFRHLTDWDWIRHTKIVEGNLLYMVYFLKC
jgi:hypothetical protein